MELWREESGRGEKEQGSKGREVNRIGVRRGSVTKRKEENSDENGRKIKSSEGKRNEVER